MDDKRPWAWVFPFAVLCLLLVMYANRWEYTGSKTSSSRVYKWKTDRWTGQNWLHLQNIRESYDKPLSSSSGNPWETRETATGVWFAATGLIVIWLFRTAQFEPLAGWRKFKEQRRETQREAVKKPPSSGEAIPASAKAPSQMREYLLATLIYFLGLLLFFAVLAAVVSFL